MGDWQEKTKEDKIKNESVCVYKPLYISCQIGRDSTKGHCSMEINFFSLVRGIIFFSEVDGLNMYFYHSLDQVSNLIFCFTYIKMAVL